MNWENILKDEKEYQDDFNEIMDSLIKATRLTKKHMRFNTTFRKAADLIIEAGKLLHEDRMQRRKREKF